jgi:hypothetical protein
VADVTLVNVTQNDLVDVHAQLKTAQGFYVGLAVKVVKNASPHSKGYGCCTGLKKRTCIALIYLP